MSHTITLTQQATCSTEYRLASSHGSVYILGLQKPSFESKSGYFHIVAQRANRYIVAFHIALLISRYHTMQTMGALLHMLQLVSGLRVRPLADADLQNF